MRRPDMVQCDGCGVRPLDEMWQGQGLVGCPDCGPDAHVRHMDEPRRPRLVDRVRREVRA